jgi:hypothetical protein
VKQPARQNKPVSGISKSVTIRTVSHVGARCRSDGDEEHLTANRQMSECRPRGDDPRDISCVHFEVTARLGLRLFGDRGSRSRASSAVCMRAEFIGAFLSWFYFLRRWPAISISRGAASAGPIKQLQSELAQSRMALRPATERPVKAAHFLFDRQIVDARQTPAHQAVFIEFPIFVAVGLNRIVAFLRNSPPQPDCRRKSKAP